MQTEAELRYNRILIEVETATRLIRKGLDLDDAIARECKTDGSASIVKANHADWKPKENPV